MSSVRHLQKSKDSLSDLIEKISLPDSPVGIDAQYTHAVIIDYLEQITERLQKIEAQLEQKK